MNLVDLLYEYQEYLILAVWLLCLLVYVLVRFPILMLKSKRLVHEALGDSSEPLSVVVIAHNHENSLEETLERIATQDYFGKYEVIVVNDSSTDDTADIIQRVENRHAHVRHTFTSDTARYMSHFKLAVTLGVRSARHEWIVLTEGDCCPSSSKWLQTLSAGCDEQHDLVLGYSNFYPVTTLHSRRYAYERFMQQLRWFRAAIVRKNSKAVGGLMCNMAFRKSLFLRNKGFSAQLHWLGGEDVLFVDTLADQGRTGVVMDSRSFMWQQLPVRHQLWTTSQLFHAAASQSLSRQGKRERFMWALSSWAAWGVLLLSVVWAMHLQPVDVHRFFFSLLPYLAVVVVFVADVLLFHRAKRLMCQSGIGRLYPLYNLIRPFQHFAFRIQSYRQRRYLMRGI